MESIHPMKKKKKPLPIVAFLKKSRREQKVLEILPLMCFDTVRAKDFFRANDDGVMEPIQSVDVFANSTIGRSGASNLQMAGQLSTGGIMWIRSLSLIADKDALPTWKTCHWTLLIGNKPQIDYPFWHPPSSTELTPMGMLSLRWNFREAYKVSPLQWFSVKVQRFDKDPDGDLRIALDCDITRELY